MQCFFGLLLVVVMRSHLLERLFSVFIKKEHAFCLNLFVSGLCSNGLFMSKKYIQIVQSFESVSD